MLSNLRLALLAKVNSLLKTPLLAAQSFYSKYPRV